MSPKKVAHKALSSLPPFLVAIYAIWAGANQAKFRKHFDWATDQMTSTWFAFGSFAFVIMWYLLWWFTGSDGQTRRDIMLDRGLRPIYEDISWVINEVKSANSMSELKDAHARSNNVIGDADEWISVNMGKGAVAKVRSVGSRSPIYYIGQGDAKLENAKLSLLHELEERQANVEVLMKSNAWDNSSTDAKLWKRWLNRVKNYRSPL